MWQKLGCMVIWPWEEGYGFLPFLASPYLQQHQIWGKRGLRMLNRLYLFMLVEILECSHHSFKWQDNFRCMWTCLEIECKLQETHNRISPSMWELLCYISIDPGLPCFCKQVQAAQRLWSRTHHHSNSQHTILS